VFLEQCLKDEMSLDAIGRLAGKHPSTVSYWLKKHELVAIGRALHAPRGNVDPERLRDLVLNGATIREICDDLDAGYSTVRHWLKKLGLQTIRMERSARFAEAREVGITRTYARCNRHGHTAFFKRPDGGFRCSRCNSVAVATRRRKVKRILVEEAGGACAACGYDRHPGALQFHHLDRNTKEFGLSRQGVTRSINAARSEAAKCVLLCANCHSEVEGGVLELPRNVSVESVSPRSTPG